MYTMISLNQTSHQSSKLSVSTVESEDASEEEGPHDDDSELEALGLYSFLGVWLTLLVVLQSSHHRLTALSGENVARGGPST